MVCHSLYPILRASGTGDVKVFCWLPMAASAILYLFGPVGGHSADSRHQIEAEAERSGRPFAEVANEVCLSMFFQYPVSPQPCV